jgi:hypothetical protein
MDGTNGLKETTRVTASVASTFGVTLLLPRGRLWSASGQSPSANRLASRSYNPINS